MRTPWLASTPCCALPPALQMMQDWLEEHELDRKALEALARNAAQVAAWEEHAALQGGRAGRVPGSQAAGASCLLLRQQSDRTQPESAV